MIIDLSHRTKIDLSFYFIPPPKYMAPENYLVTGRQYQNLSSEIKPVPMTMKTKAKDIVTE